MIDLNDLLTRSADKDQIAFKTLYAATSPRLFSVLMGMLKNEALAEDILQDSYLKIWEKAKTFKSSKSNAMTWMRTITANTARDKLRALKVRHYKDECGDYIENLESEGSTPEREHLVATELSRIVKAMKGLKEVQRECLILSCYHGYSHAELASKLGQPLGTIKTWIRLGKEQVMMPA